MKIESSPAPQSWITARVEHSSAGMMADRSASRRAVVRGGGGGTSANVQNYFGGFGRYVQALVSRPTPLRGLDVNLWTLAGLAERGVDVGRGFWTWGNKPGG